MYRPRSTAELYDTFRAGYYDQNVAPGGVGAIYARLGADYDPEPALSACGELAARAASEGITVSAAAGWSP
jgi:hypothetical protein